MLREYIYVDEKRLNGYFEQISDPVKYDKVNEWSTELGITGPKAAGKQIRAGRPYTTHEKITAVETFIDGEDLIASYSSLYVGLRSPLFMMDQLRGSRVNLPLSSVGGQDLTIWFGRVHGGRTNLILFEDGPANKEYRSDAGMSGFSAFMLLAREVPSIWTSVPPPDDADSNWKYYFASGTGLHDFMLRNNGTELPPRQIQSLFFIRDSFYDYAETHEPFCVFGYPIYIAAV